MSTREIVEELRERPVSLSRAFVVRVFHVMVERFDRNQLLTFASAMAVQLLTAVVPLALLSLLLVGAFGRESYWRQEVAPRIAAEASGPIYQAIDSVVEGLISTFHGQWLAFAAVLVLWEVSGAVRTVMGALNSIRGLEEDRSFGHRFGLSFALAAGVTVGLLAALLIAIRGGGWVSIGGAQFVWTAVRWLSVLVLLWAVVALLLRYAANGEERAGWVTFGAALIVVSWIGASLVYGWWVTSQANYKTAFGAAIAVITLVGYLYTTSIVFLVGAQVDQLLREQAASGEGPLDGVL